MTKSGATCFETVDDLGDVDGLAGNNLEARSQDSVTNFGIIEAELDPKFARWGGPMVETEVNSEIAHWREHVDVLRQYKPASDELMDELWGIATSHSRKDSITYSETIPKEFTIPDKQCQCGFDPGCGLAPWQNSGYQSNSTTPLETEIANII